MNLPQKGKTIALDKFILEWIIDVNYCSHSHSMILSKKTPSIYIPSRRQTRDNHMSLNSSNPQTTDNWTNACFRSFLLRAEK